MALEYFTEAELRALPQMDNETKFTLARCEAAAAYIVAVIEREVGTSFISRTVTGQTYDGDGTSVLRLRTPHVLSVTSATVGGVAVTDTLTVRGGLLRRYASGASVPGMWAKGLDNIAVTYASGYSSTVPADVKEAALKGTRAHLLSTMANSAMDDRRTSMTSDMGTVSFVVAGADRPTGYPDVDAVIMAWRKRLNVYGWA